MVIDDWCFSKRAHLWIGPLPPPRGQIGQCHLIQEVPVGVRFLSKNIDPRRRAEVAGFEPKRPDHEPQFMCTGTYWGDTHANTYVQSKTKIKGTVGIVSSNVNPMPTVPFILVLLSTELWLCWARLK
jgi:hypothetical protein